MNTNKHIQALTDGQPHEIVKSIISGIREFYLGMLSSSVRNDCADVFDNARTADATFVAYRAVQERFAALLATHQPAPAVKQPIIGRLMDEVAQLPVLWGLGEPGALLRHSDVTRVLVETGKEYPAAHPPADAAPAWDINATTRLRSIVGLLGLQSVMPDGDLTGYEFAVLGFVRREIERLKAKADAAPVDAKPVGIADCMAISLENEVQTNLAIFARDQSAMAAARLVQSVLAAQPSSAQGAAVGQQAGVRNNVPGSQHNVCRNIESDLRARIAELEAALAQRAASQPDAKLYFGFTDENAAIEAAKRLSLIGVQLNESGALDLCHAFLKLRKPDSERDAARYRELRDHGLFVAASSGVGWSIRRNEPPSTAAEMDAAMDEHMRLKAMSAQQGEKGGAA